MEWRMADEATNGSLQGRVRRAVIRKDRAKYDERLGGLEGKGLL